jgi:hypothetical protein
MWFMLVLLPARATAMDAPSQPIADVSGLSNLLNTSNPDAATRLSTARRLEASSPIHLAVERRVTTRGVASIGFQAASQMRGFDSHEINSAFAAGPQQMDGFAGAGLSFRF